MGLERTRACPECDAEQAFYRSASTYLHLGLKVKWTCSECDYQFVEVNGIVSDQVEG